MKRVWIVALITLPSLSLCDAGPNRADFLERSQSDATAAVRPLERHRFSMPLEPGPVAPGNVARAHADARQEKKTVVKKPMVLFADRDQRVSVQAIVGQVNGAQLSVSW
jgi:hypothetical protein